jgi:histidinol-phosphate aminotransferase
MARHQITRRDLGRVVASAAVAASWRPGSASGSTVGASPLIEGGPIRIGSNENPHGLGRSARAAIAEALAEANRYPFDTIARLNAAVAASHDVSRDWVALTPGSGEILRAATVAFTSSNRALVAATPTFEAPARTAGATGATVRNVPVLASGSLDLEAMASQAAGAGLFFVCNPNNPTGGVSSADAVRDFIARVRRTAPDAVLLMDEAYHDYVDDPGYASAIALVRTDPRILVSRTFSKIYGMAGLRVGYAVAQPDTLDAMRRVLSQGSLSNVSTAAALAAFTDRDDHARQRALNRDTKAFTRKAFEDAGFRVLPSEANFVMVDVRRDVSSFGASCRAAGVSIARPFPPLRTHARITIGTPEEMQRAVPAMLSALQTPSSAGPDEAIKWEAGC